MSGERGILNPTIVEGCGERFSGHWIAKKVDGNEIRIRTGRTVELSIRGK